MPSANVRWPIPLMRFPTLWPGQFGVPGTDHTRGIRTDVNGAVFYVDPNAAGVSDQRDGTDPEGPLATVGAALLRCRAFQNDTIVVAPSSYWTYGDVSVGRALPVREEVTISTPGVRIVGRMPGSMGVPWLVTQNNGIAITVNAMDITIEGFLFWEDTYTNPVAIQLEWDGPPYGENTVIRNNAFMDGLDYGIRMDFPYNTHIYHNTFQEAAVAAIESMDVAGDPDYSFIYENLFNYNAVAIDLEDVTRCMIVANMINGNPAGANNFIDLTGGSNNFVANNFLACSIAQYDSTCSDATSGSWLGNYCTDGSPVAPPT